MIGYIVEDKWTIVGVTLVFIVFSLMFSFFSTQLWTSTAIIGKEQNFTESEPRLLANKILLNIDDQNKKLTSEKIEKILNKTNLLDRFFALFYSFDMRKEFLLSQGISNDFNKINYWSSKLEIIKYHNINNTFLISFSYKNPKESLALLNKYTSYIVDKTNEELRGSLQSIKNINESYIETKLASLRKEAKEKLARDIIISEKSLLIAKVAGVNKPLENMNDNELFPIELGEKAISEKIAILKGGLDLSLLNPNIDNLEYKLKELKEIDVKSMNKVSVFHYIKSPEQPIKPDNLSKLLLLFFSTFIGVVTGSLLVCYKKTK